MYNLVGAQIVYEEIGSVKLNTHRKLKIKLPKNYDEDSDLKHPLIIVFDGDYLFEPVAGNIDYQAYWEDIPDCVIVGIKQSKSRDLDFLYDEYSCQYWSI